VELGWQPGASARRRCTVCLAQTHSGFRHCHGCEVVRRQLGGSLVRVRPVRLAPRGGDLHRHLVAYKAAPSRAVRTEAGSRLVELLVAYLTALVARSSAGSQAAPRPSIVLATVPSSGTGRRSWDGTHPLVTVARAACARFERGDIAWHGTVCYAADLLRRGPGPLGHLCASTDGYLVTRPDRVQGGRLLVVDDLYASGARAQSAAYACTSAGLAVLAIAPLGRLVERDDNGPPGAGAPGTRVTAVRSPQPAGRATTAAGRTTSLTAKDR